MPTKPRNKRPSKKRAAPPSKEKSGVRGRVATPEQEKALAAVTEEIRRLLSTLR